MSDSRLIAKNTAILFAGEVLNRLLSFFLVIFIARQLGTEGLGKYSFVFAFIGIFSVISDMGTSTYLTREIARDKSITKKYLGNVFSFKLLASSIAIILPVIFIMFTSQESSIKTGVLIGGVAMFFYYMSSPFKAVIAGFERQEYHAIYTFSERFIAFALGIVLMYMGYGLLPLLSVFVVSHFAGFAIIYILTSKKISKLDIGADYRLIKNILKKSMPFWFTAVFMTIYFRIDTVMLSFMKGYSATGWYNASYKIIDAMSFVPFVIIAAVYPAMSKFYNKNHDYLQLVYQKSFYYLALLAIPLGIGVSMLADRLIFFVYKEGFSNSVIILQVLIWALVLIFVNYLMGYMLNSIEKQKLFMWTTAASAIVNIILNLLLIPRFSYIGAAFATVLAELLNFIILYYHTSNSGFKIKFTILLRPAMAAVIMGVSIFYLSALHLLIVLPTSMLIYFAALYMIGGIKDEEISLVKSMFSK